MIDATAGGLISSAARKVSKRISVVSLAFVTALALALVASGCSTTDEARSQDPDRIDVVATFYPLQWLAERVGGDVTDVRSLTPHGVEPHDLVLDAKAIEKMRNADVALFLGGDFQPDVEGAIATLPERVAKQDLLQADGIALLSGDRVEAHRDEESGDHANVDGEDTHGEQDPHVWLDPLRMQPMAKSVAAVLKQAAPDHATAIDANLEQTVRDLAGLHGDMSKKLAGCAGRALVTSHAAFAYLADRYQLQQLAIAGISPDEEPDAKALELLAATARAHRVTTIYSEEALPADLAKTVADEIGAKTDQLSTLETAPAGASTRDGYVDAQLDNANRLARGLGCES